MCCEIKCLIGIIQGHKVEVKVKGGRRGHIVEAKFERST